ncbi:M20/M25/M40 family metallo-hydrolase [Chryseobacterium sp. SNU WT5]|uniref:M28 family peptidase n=1 Tax=Chryseobacterium sp. SNU WT5 TaxID=2594269 RepID=UPI00117F06B1|nr:M28 family peptidase [Chryseobacterium sp. SNU WT5]QDP86402.1 M20/M25/M40 family metallo-hydrolase [Chryseobacterium sp. SNU WT5]
MKSTLLIPMLLIASLGYSQTFIQAYKTRAQLVTQANINTHLSNFASYGIKKTGTTANNNAAAWLQSEYSSFGYTASEITTQNFTYNGNSTKNIIVTKTGTTYPNTFIIICGHYDTVGGVGANDNGSGVSIILEAARILKNVPTEYSIKFINFSGEEQGLLGSQSYVTNVVNATNPKMDIKLVFNIDQVGGKAGANNTNITVDYDDTPYSPNGMYPGYPSSNNAASVVVSNQLKTCMELYSPLTASLFYGERTDYIPFDKNGEIFTGLYETIESARPHTSGDTVVNMDPVYLLKVAQGAIGGLQHFAGASTTVLGTTDVKKELKDRVSIFPNPANDFINIGIDGKGYNSTVTDMSGRTLINSKDEQTINTSKLKTGVYLLTVVEDGQSTTKKFIIKK